MENLKIQIGDEKYPKLLSQIDGAPKLINFRGNIEALNRPCISVVGTRRASAYGLYCCKKLISELSGISDLCIVSGLAKGIDSMAHEIALENGLYTIAVLGSGLNNIYPRENRLLAEKITKHGALISEFPDDTGVKKHHFPLRNRIISGLSHATLAVEAPEKSGTLITMKMALNQNRICICVPSDIDRVASNGVLKLIQNGEAYPVSSGREILEYLRENNFLFKEECLEEKKFKKKTLVLKDPFENLLYTKLAFSSGSSIFELCRKTNFDVPAILSCVSKLEMKGLIKVKAGLYYKI